ncbi:MAG: DUF389 domain-containing protein [Saprospiraceae bacterium]|nr:DUF389 domain-containing protein [Saprospiraceae bacterium]
MKREDVIAQLLHYFNLEAEVDDFDKIHESITKDIVFKGTNLWILIFAIVVASVGLNINSTAVIIGAMLISPLMGPINGMGYSIATYDFPLFKKALKNFGFAVVASLFTSMMYFVISPISTAHSELLARTSPTIYDVLIAMFGGLAGIVAISSRQKGNVIPGVAIATALMPPLCTAGYGLATGQFAYFFGAFYLFAINTVFIALSSVIISQILKFPIRASLEPSEKVRVNRAISAVIILMLIPSIYFGYNLVQKERFSENAAKYVQNVGVVEGNYLLKHEINADRKTIDLTYGGASLSEEDKKAIKDKTATFSLSDATINFRQGLVIEEISSGKAEVETLKSELSRLNRVIREKDEYIDSTFQVRFTGRQILAEIKPLYPQVVTCAFADTYIFDGSDKSLDVSMVIFGVAGDPIKEQEQVKIEAWLRSRLQNDRVRVYFEKKSPGTVRQKGNEK